MRAFLIRLSVLILILVSSAPAFAWKVSMHIYLAELARQDAIDDGKVTINRVKYDVAPGQIPNILGTVGTYAVDSELQQALRLYPQWYRAGVMGPDAYPDIATGQTCIHGDDKDGAPGGSNSWLEYIWLRSLDPRLTGEKRLKVRAFAAGFLTHAAGDMFGHTMVNVYAGGDWNIIGSQGRNPLRHIVYEGYIARRMPDLSPDLYDVRIDGIEDWLYTTLIDARRGTILADRLLLGVYNKVSIPWIFSRLRDRLVDEIDEYNRHTDDPANVAFNGPAALYKRAWVDDIDAGLLEWVKVSHRIAKLIVFHPPSPPNEYPSKIDQAMDVLRQYFNQHLMSMLGAPDFAGVAAHVLHTIIDAITRPFQAMLHEIKIAILDFLLTKATGKTYAQLKAYLTNPEMYFDQVMGPSLGLGSVTTLQETNRDELRLTDTGFTNPAERWDYKKVPAAYNTMVLSKLILVTQPEINRLLQDLGAGTRGLSPANARALDDRNRLGLAMLTNQQSMLSLQPITVEPLPRLDMAAVKRPPETVPAEQPPSKADAPRMKIAAAKIPIGLLNAINTLGASLPPKTPLPPGIAMSLPNVMLGYNRKLDGNNQWWGNPQQNYPQHKMIFIYAGNYSQLFFKFTGDLTPTSTPIAPPPQPDLFPTVSVTINRIKQLDGHMEGPFGGAADFYARVFIAGDWFVTDDILNDDEVSPNWTFRKVVQRSMNVVPIVIEIWDEDGGLGGADDMVDVNWYAGRSLYLYYDFRTRRFTGSASGQAGVPVKVSGTESDNAELTFTVNGT